MSFSIGPKSVVITLAITLVMTGESCQWICCVSDESKKNAHCQLVFVLDAHQAFLERNCREENLKEGSPWRGWRGTRKEM